MPGFIDEGPETGRRDFNWKAQGGGLTVELRSLTVGTGFTRMELRVNGVRRGRAVSALQHLRIRDADGGDLLADGEIARIDTAGSRPAPGGGIDTEVVLDQPIDLQAVAAVELAGLTVGRNVRERVGGTLVDAEPGAGRRHREDASGWPSAAAAPAASSAWPARTAPPCGSWGRPTAAAGCWSPSRPSNGSS